MTLLTPTPTLPAVVDPLEPQRLVALVDLFNVASSPRTDIDYEEALLLVADLIRRGIKAASSSPTSWDVTCRLYGGFVDINGGPTDQYSRLLRRIRLLRGVESKVRILPEAARGLQCMPQALLKGTYKNGGQKMVDQMMAHDAYELASRGDCAAVLLVSDDEDFVPCVITVAARTSTPVWWLRKRAWTRNDDHFTGMAVHVLTDKAWT